MMARDPRAAFIEMARSTLPRSEAELVADLHRFTGDRLEAAGRLADRLGECSPDDSQGAALDLHAFLRECWEALDGLAREVNVCMRHMFPRVNLYPPLEMTRQCTFYTVRKALHEHPDTAAHPVSRLLWGRTRQEPDQAHRYLSFLHNLSLFMPVAIIEGKWLPGTEDLKVTTRQLVKPASFERWRVHAGVAAMLTWLGMLTARCYQHLADGLEGWQG
jgi:hypothetical protein